MHISLAQRLIRDVALPSLARDLLRAQWGAFLLGSIAPDARVSSGIERSNTHFFEYGPQIDPPPDKAMLNRFPELARQAIEDDTRAVFIAGYAAHLAMDEIWCTDILFPMFVNGGDWGTRETKFLVLHLLLADLDRRDRSLIPPEDYDALAAAIPKGWLPFMTDEGLVAWRNIIAEQLAPGGKNRTTEILGNRVGLAPEMLDATIDDPQKMQELTWNHVPPPRVAAAEEAMYVRSRDAVITYLSGT